MKVRSNTSRSLISLAFGAARGASFLVVLGVLFFFCSIIKRADKGSQTSRFTSGDRITGDEIFSAFESEQEKSATQRQQMILYHLRKNANMSGLESEWQRNNGAIPINQSKR